MLVAPLVTVLLLAGCASKPSPLEQALVSPTAQGAGGTPAIIPTVAAASAFDDPDQAAMIQHFNRAMESAPTGQAVTWTNPSSGTMIQLSVTRTFQRADDTYCREFTQSIMNKDQPSTTKGTACRQSDGTWQIIG
jgi:surface antigen